MSANKLKCNLGKMEVLQAEGGTDSGTETSPVWDGSALPLKVQAGGVVGPGPPAGRAGGSSGQKCLLPVLVGEPVVAFPGQK